MRLWGKVMSGSLLVFAAVFAGVGLLVPEARAACLGAAAVSAAAALLGVPLLLLWSRGSQRSLSARNTQRAVGASEAPPGEI